MDDLLDIMRYRRKAWSKGEEQMIAKHIDSVPGMKIDDFGNRYIVVGVKPTVMFSSHTDTMDRGGGSTTTQKIAVDSHLNQAFVQGKGKLKKQLVLGADDAVGVWIMLNMIAANKRGLYIFHRAEECGGLGSDFVARTQAKGLLKDITSCVAFDRKDTTNVITHQGGERCASDDYANALCRQLNGMMGQDAGWRKDDTGIFTDSANYMYDIAECTNLSCGYYHEHTNREYVDLDFAWKFMNACISVDWHGLPIKRDPTEVDMADSYGYGGTYSFGSSRKGYLDDEVDYDTTFYCWDDAYDLACRSPEQAADLLWAYCSGRKRA